MKRILLIGLILCSVMLSSNLTANAFNLGLRKAYISYNNKKNIKTDTKQVENVITSQLNYANKHNIEGLKSLYSKDFINNDGFNKEAYFKLIEDTWETYPDISYETTIKEISLDGKFASVEAFESAVAVAYDTLNDAKIAGELNAFSKCIYHLEKVGDKWIITSENALEEYSHIKFGNARYINMQLNVPKQTHAGKDYSTTLKIDIPDGYSAIGAISRGKVIHPEERPETAFRSLPQDNILERIFTANTDNVNEYNVASVVIANSTGEGEDTRVYMQGIATIISRVNVVAENKYVNFEEEDAKTK